VARSVNEAQSVILSQLLADYLTLHGIDPQARRGVFASELTTSLSHQNSTASPFGIETTRYLSPSTRHSMSPALGPTEPEG
jgi:hypothetical protein